ncbi:MULTISPECIES: phosphotransferase family protein [unclassified Pseudomonas]|uniref:phosphotransferase family protein n=1 Tax=unclassified Pseudomonas TaxID=196821 RepID=UPI0025FC5127|nr:MULTISPECIES: phosphotransferase family protein [unclassified Pseudomonas]
METSQTPGNADQLLESKLRRCVEQAVGGQVTAMQRLIRWRPAWNVEVLRDGKVMGVHIRGERGGDVSPFPDLRREAQILTLLHEQGIPMPRIYGFCEDPQAIIMELVPGTRDVKAATDDQERSSVARQWVRAMAAMHQLPLPPFVQMGIKNQSSADEIALAGLEAYYPLYQRNKTQPEPLAEFALGWLRRNVPQHRTRAAFVQYDSGQYLFEAGQVNALYDFEFALIGDPLADLASARMRDNYEPLGESFSELYRYYQQLTGEPAEPDVVRYHTVLFATVSTLQFSSTVATPQPGDPHDTYLEFDLALRRVVVHALAEAMGVPIIAAQQTLQAQGPNHGLLTMLSDALAQVWIDDPFQQSRLTSVNKLVEYLSCADAMTLTLQAQDRQEAQTLLGHDLAHGQSLDAALETFVAQAGPEHDRALLTLFMSQIERRVQVFGKTAIGGSASHIDLPPL